MAILLICNGNKFLYRLVMTDDLVVLGRDYGCDIQIHDPTLVVSRVHASIVRFGKQRFLVEDLKSTHGTLLNGRRVKKRSILGDGDMISFGMGLGIPYILFFRDAFFNQIVLEKEFKHQILVESSTCPFCRRIDFKLFYRRKKAEKSARDPNFVFDVVADDWICGGCGFTGEKLKHWAE